MIFFLCAVQMCTSKAAREVRAGSSGDIRRVTYDGVGGCPG